MKAKFPLLALGVLAGGLLSSCSTENEPTINGMTGNMLVKAPQAKAYLGGEELARGTRGVNVNINELGMPGKWDCPTAPELTPEDIANIKALLEKGVPTYNDVVLPFENYFVEQVYKGQNPQEAYNSHDRCEQAGCNHVNGETVLGSGHMDLLYAYNDILENDWDIWGRTQFNDCMYEHVNNFNNGNNTNTPGACANGHVHKGLTLMTGMPTEGIDPNKQFGYHETYGTAPKYYNNYIIVEYNGYWYVGFDYEAHKNDQTTHNHGEGMDVERDWNFTDWIVRITPAYHYGETPAENPGKVPGDSTVDPEPQPEPETCPKCGDETHEPGECPNPDCDNEECHPSNPGVNPPVDEDKPAGDKPAADNHKDEVEINLSLDEKDDDNIRSSHLSMHVRSATDVEVFIPVPAQYYCDADDMAIVMKHEGNHMSHGGPYEFTYKLKDSDLTVSLYVQYEENGIRIWTDGITQEVIDWCEKKVHDGITFEVWNYFNDPETGNPLISIEELRSYLDQATVKFLDKIPEHYINAFAEPNDKYGEGGTSEGDDFHVRPEEQRDQFSDPRTGPHLNGSTENEIYDRK